MEGEANWPVVPQVLLLALFEDWSDIGYFPVLRQFSCSPVLHDLSEMMESGPAMAYASSLRTHGCIP